MMEIKQNKQRIVQSKNTVDWLVHHTDVRTFNPVTFEGYQRQIDDKHARLIVEYIQKRGFYFPTAIICSDDHLEEEKEGCLHIVDGQHRVQAFKIIKEENAELYNIIKDFEIPVIVLVKPELSTEIDTFITINKSSKKVDTSLALVLKNKIQKEKAGEMSNLSRREYLAVEVARIINTEKDYYLWNDKILFEGSLINRSEYITLNGFVRSMRALLGALDKQAIIKCSWDSSITIDELESKKKLISELVEYIWETVYEKWPELKTNNQEDSRIIQGTIGFTAINRFLICKTKEFYGEDINVYKKFIRKTILDDVNVSAERWKKGGIYSKFTSESGYSAIVEDLLGNGIG